MLLSVPQGPHPQEQDHTASCRGEGVNSLCQAPGMGLGPRRCAVRTAVESAEILTVMRGKDTILPTPLLARCKKPFSPGFPDLPLLKAVSCWSGDPQPASPSSERPPSPAEVQSRPLRPGSQRLCCNRRQTRETVRQRSQPPQETRTAPPGMLF